MPNQDDLPQLQCDAIRVCYLDRSGVPRPGADNMYVSGALTSLGLTPVYSDGDEIEEKNAAGSVCVNFVSDDSFKRADVEITICTEDPWLVTMLGGGDVLEDAGLRGHAAPPIGSLGSQDYISVELWSKRVDDGVLHPDFPYAWWVLPLLKNRRVGLRTFANASRNPVFTARAYENLNWFDGPLNDWPAASDRVWQWFPTPDLPEIGGPVALAAS